MESAEPPCEKKFSLGCNWTILRPTPAVARNAARSKVMLRTSANGMAPPGGGLHWSSKGWHPQSRVHISPGIAETARQSHNERRDVDQGCLHRETRSKRKLRLD